MNLCLQQSYACLRPKCSPHKNPKPRIKNPKSPFRKSYPTPLLINRNDNVQSRLQGLESVVSNLESSMKNGVSINDPQIFASLLESCFQLGATNYVSRIHKLIPAKLLRKNAGISSKLLRLYACNGEVENAHEVFDVMPDRNSSAFPWNSLISGYAEARLYEDAVALYFQMVEDGVEPDEYTFPRALKACGGIGMVQVGEEIHRHVLRYGFGNNAYVLNALVDMYSKCGDILRARKVFDSIDEKELVSWNSMIVGYAQHGRVGEALSLLHKMMITGIDPDSVTLSTLLSVFSATLRKPGAQIHGWIVRRGMGWNPSIANALILFYSKEMTLAKARWLFDQMPDKDRVSWNSIISAHSSDALAVEYFDRMLEGFKGLPDAITFIGVLSACAHLGEVKKGERIFSMMEERFGIEPRTEHYGCMVNLYARAGLIDEAYEFVVRRIDNGAAGAGAAAWGALLYGCFVHGNAEIGEIAAEHLFEMEPECAENFQLLVEIYEKNGRYEDAERIRGMMLERGLHELG
ncbi:pentatricopeptide repeat-containing protein At4g25270, chloroplastic [Andrographis paniculata]|uniref:pentatricopeptide repeat-containing protein At4g25270, chloroplastic n=1 Tax=Andrographis paniculata TaxID=175694 RepID=UPI0021E70AE0|nr:pentatricopeptide repeat-containing protein At4g25270, chloroplastic [Andrographis paniculata]XP_051142974.1 pentatricopeptide repeat-containing protein At4g25270, chloroplastic [Andrographis paniculata]